MKDKPTSLKRKTPVSLKVRLEEWLYHSGDSEEILLFKKVWFGIAFSSLSLGVIALVVYGYLGYPILVCMMTFFCGYFLLNLWWFFRIRRYTERFFFFAEIFKILFAFASVLVTGGILSSGGFVLIGLAGIFFALIFPGLRRVLLLLLLYLTTISLEAILQPMIEPAPVRFTEKENLTLFVLYFWATAVSLFIFMRIYLRGRTKSRQPEEEQHPDLDGRLLMEVNHYLEQHYPDEAFGITELCHLTQVSRTQLHRKLTALTGQSASHYIRSFRLNKARDLLHTTRMTVAEVAYATGFKDAYYFSRTFTQEFGFPPSEGRTH